VPRLPSLRPRHADGLRRGHEEGDGGDGRRDAGRPRGPRRSGLRRAGGPRARQGARARGIARADVYITNVVKHFKFEERGKRRIHQTPKKFEVDACLPWLREELRVVEPEVLVILGATAGKALLGSGFRLRDVRGQPIESALAAFVTATTHPSAILRAPDDAARHAEREAFTEDLRRVAEHLAR
jgi:uracil-DNA glycosylase family 4